MRSQQGMGIALKMVYNTDSNYSLPLVGLASHKELQKCLSDPNFSKGEPNPSLIGLDHSTLGLRLRIFTLLMLLYDLKCFSSTQDALRMPNCYLVSISTGKLKADL